MSTSQPSHADLPEELTWDLTGMYADDAAWEADFLTLDGADKPLQVLRGKLSESAANLAAVFELEDAVDRRLETLYTYAHLRADEDTSNTHYMGMQDRIRSRYMAFGSTVSWITPEIMAIDPARLDELRAEPAMAPYQRALDKMVRYRPHTLSASEERLMAMASEPLGAAQKAFSMLNSADLKFPKVTDAKGEQVQLTHGNYIRFLESTKRDVRRGGFEALYDTYATVKNTLAATLDGNVRKNVFNAKARHHDSALSSSLFADNVDQAVYDGLIAAVHQRLPDFHRYLELRGRVLGIDDLDMHDVYVPMIADYELEVPWEQACEWVLAAVAPLGEEYQSIVGRAFSERWVDVLECQGKRPGAYSSGCYDSNPFILMNYQDNLNSAFTLAHEVGHSLHSWYSHENQAHIDASYTIFVAEVASITNEALLFDYLVKQSTDPQFTAYLYNHQCDGFRGTLYRQTMFAEFEKLIHGMAESGQPLTPDSLSDAYYELNATFHGPPVTADRRIALEWMRIPHFYYNFYVYKYATGFAAAQIFAQRILSGDKEAVDKYLGFLKAGGSKDPLDILTDAGVDLRDPAVIEQALDAFAASVTKLDGLLTK